MRTFQQDIIQNLRLDAALIRDPQQSARWLDAPREDLFLPANEHLLLCYDCRVRHVCRLDVKLQFYDLDAMVFGDGVACDNTMRVWEAWHLSREHVTRLYPIWLHSERGV